MKKRKTAAPALPHEKPAPEKQRTPSAASTDDSKESAQTQGANGSRAANYLQTRGVHPESISAFRLEFDIPFDSKRLCERLHLSEKAVAAYAANWIAETIWFPVFADGGSTLSHIARLLPCETPKFLSPQGEARPLYVSPQAWQVMEKRERPLWVTEGPVKTIVLAQSGAAAIGFSGVWQKRAESGIVVPEPLRLFDLRERVVYFAFDKDFGTNPSVLEAIIRSFLLFYKLGANVRILHWKLSEGKGVDDFLAHHCGAEPDGQKTLLAKLQDEPLELEQILNSTHLGIVTREIKLAALASVQIDQLSKRFARALRATATRLYQVLKPEENSAKTSVHSQSRLLEELEPWDKAVDGRALVHDLTRSVREYIVFDDSLALLSALWSLMAYNTEHFDILPLLTVTSPATECGKSTLIGWLVHVCPRPLIGTNVTEAALFRSITKWKPTVFVDEADLTLKDNEPLRALINASHFRMFAHVPRCLPPDNEVFLFHVWAPKVFATIGRLTITHMNRSIVIPLERSTDTDSLKRLPASDTPEFKILRRKMLRWSEDHGSNLRGEIPRELSRFYSGPFAIPFELPTELVLGQLAPGPRETALVSAGRSGFDFVATSMHCFLSTP